MNATTSVLVEASLSFDCRPLFRWVGCGPTYQYALRIFYSIYFCIHAISTIVALVYTGRTFFHCCGRQVDRRTRKMSLRVFTSFSLVAFSSVTIYCYFLIDPRAFYLPTWFAGLLWGLACNALGCAAALLIFTWAEAMDENSMKVSSGLLSKYKPHFYVVLVDRVLSTALMVFAGADVGGNTYLILLRLFCAHWSAYALFLAVSMFYYGSKMIGRLRLIGAPKAVERTRRVVILYVGASGCCSVCAAVQVGIQHIMEVNFILWMVVIGAFHAIIMVLATWFIFGRPSRNDLQRDSNTSKTLSSMSSRSEK